jgi:hypothetical protein
MTSAPAEGSRDHAERQLAEPMLIVGDVQGCRAELDDLLQKAGFDPTRRRLTFVGDLINRGPDSLGVLRRARELDALAVVGNHEDGLLFGKSSETLDRVRKQLGPELREWMKWLNSLPVFIVHAGIPPGKTPETSTRAELTRIRDVDGRPWFDAWIGPETVVFGHWSVMGKVDRPLVKGLDTGCVYGKSLTGLLWPELEWVEVPAHRAWFDPQTMKPLW